MESGSIVDTGATILVSRCSAIEQRGSAAVASRPIGERKVVRDRMSRNLGGERVACARRAGNARAVAEPAALPSRSIRLAASSITEKAAGSGSGAQLFEFVMNSVICGFSKSRSRAQFAHPEKSVRCA